MFKVLQEERVNDGLEDDDHLEESALNAMKRVLVKGRRWMTGRDKKKMNDLRMTGSFQKYLEDIIEDVKLLDDPNDLQSYQKTIDNYIVALNDDIEMGEEDLENEEKGKLETSNVRLMVKNMKTFRNNLKQVSNRISKKVEMLNKHKIDRDLKD